MAVRVPVPVPVAVADRDEALRQLFEEQYRSLVRLAALLTDDRESAEDVVQEAFVRMYLSWGQLRDLSAVGPYLRSIVLNLARSGLRRRLPAKRRGRGVEGHVVSAEDDVLLREDQRAVLAALRSLPRRQRECLTLRYYLEWSEAEIAAGLGISAGSVKSHSSRGVAARSEAGGGQVSTGFDDVGVEERLRDAARAYTNAIEPDPDAWLRLRTSIEDRRVRPRYQRRRVVAIAFAAAIAVAVVVTAAVVIIDGRTATKVSVPPATRPHLPVPNVALDHELLVTPSSGLRDGQPIRVSGRHFIITVGRTQNVSRIVVVTCRAGATPANWDQQCDPHTDAGAPTSAGRNRELRRTAKPGPARETCCLDVVADQYAAVRHLNLPGGPVDCALEPCVVLMFGANTRYGVAPLRFDAGAASLPTPQVTVTPSTDLQEGQQVTVHIEDAWPGGANHRGVSLNLCGGPGDARACDQTDLGVPPVTGIDGQGRATLTITVRSAVLSDGCCTHGNTAGVADCTHAPGCVLLLRVPAGPLAGQTSELAIPITFSTDVNARPLTERLPHATIDPPGPYTDGQQATITATGVPAGTAIGQCARFDPSPTATSPPTFLHCAGGATGNGTLVLHRFIDSNPHQDKIDCSEPGRCALYLYTTDPNRGGGLPPAALLEIAPLSVN